MVCGIVQGIGIITVKTEFQCLKHLRIKLFELNKSIWESLRKFFSVFIHKFNCRIIGCSVYNELREILSTLFRGIGGLKTRGSTPFERCYCLNPLIFAQYIINGISHSHCFRQPGSFRQIYFDSKLVPFRTRHHSLLYSSCEEKR